MPLVRILGRDNGAGLSRDLTLVAGLLAQAGNTIEVVGFGNEKGIRTLRQAGMWVARSWQGRADLQISLEHVYPLSLGLAKRNWLIPNPEWFRDRWLPVLPRFDQVLCKTRHAQRIFADLGSQTAFIGFTCDDRMDATVQRQPGFFHLAGRSPVKGTEVLLEAWRRRPDWPKLVVVQGRKTARPGPVADNIEHRIGHIEDGELRRLQNTYPFHICPSEAEGFGHCLAEAMSVGAVTVTVDGEPMNELIEPGHGVLIAPARVGQLGLAKRYYVDVEGVDKAVDGLLALPASEREAMGARARCRFQAMDLAFRQRLVEEARES